MAIVFTHHEDFLFFDRLLTELGGIAQNTHLFDFRDPAEKRKEFNCMRKQVFKSLVVIYGLTCQLNCHADCTGTASEVDHLIPLSSNVLNKKLRNIRGASGKKTPAQSFGSNHQDNFVLACSRCNAFKKHRLPTQKLIQGIIDIRNKIPTQVELSHVDEISQHTTFQATVTECITAIVEKQEEEKSTVAFMDANEEISGNEVVYGLRMRSESKFFHIGSGSEQRANNLKQRSSAVLSYIEARGGISQVEVTIIERYQCPARARLREMELIGLHQPCTNTFGRSSIPAGILDGRPKGSNERCCCGAPNCYGVEVSSRSQ